MEKKAGVFVKKASEKRDKSAKLKKCQQFKQIQKLKIAKIIVWKQAMENEKKMSKTRNKFWETKKLLIRIIDFDVGKNH